MKRVKGGLNDFVLVVLTTPAVKHLIRKPLDSNDSPLAALVHEAVQPMLAAAPEKWFLSFIAGHFLCLGSPPGTCR